MQPDRIDFTVLADNQVVITKMRRDLSGPKPRDIPLVGGSSTKPAGFDLAEALAWCKDNGYTVRQWDTGARAWKGQPWVIRTRRGIKRAREQFSGDGKAHMDFAYEA